MHKWLSIILLISTPVLANEAEVIKVQMKHEQGNRYTFYVTLKHDDTGWDHYADAWSVLDEKKQLISTRILYHPHENEQPFTRSLSGVAIPEGSQRVYVRPHDKVHGDGALYEVTLAK